MIGDRLILAAALLAAGVVSARMYQLDANLADTQRELVAVARRDVMPENPLAAGAVITGRATWVSPPELQAELDQLRARTEYLRIIAQIIVAESDTKRVELPRPDPWVAWPAIVVPTERKGPTR